MPGDLQIKDILKLFFKQEIDKEEFYLKAGKASNINLDNFTFKFTPNDESSPVENALLKSIETSTGGSFVIVPAEDSFVIVGFSSDVTAFCLFVETSDLIIQKAVEIRIDAENINTNAENINTIAENININADQIIYNGGNNEGIIKIIEITEKLNAHIAEFNAFIGKYNTHTHKGVATGTGTSAATLNQASEADDFTKTDYENQKITH